MISGGFALFGKVPMRSRWKLWITIENFMNKRKDRLDPVHPGDVLREDFMKPLGLSAYVVAKAIGATPIAISEIIRRKRAVSAESAEMSLKLGRLFNVSPELWMGIQADYDLELARDRSEAQIFRRVHPLKLTNPVPA
jgi:antitoxin HigA-1